MSDRNNQSSFYSSFLEISRPMKRRKILLLGAPKSGKSALIFRFKENTFTDTYVETIHSIIEKFLPFRNEYFDLEIVDLNGQSEFTIFSPKNFSFGIHGYLLVYSIDNRKSFEMVNFINDKLNSIVGKKVAKVVVATKSDMRNIKQVNTKEGKDFANSINSPFIECSSKDNINVQKAFLMLLTEINKIESNFNINTLCCSGLFKMVSQHEPLMKKIVYFLLVLLFIFGIISVSIGILSLLNEMRSESYEYFPSFYGLWLMVFSVIGILGLKKNKLELLNVLFIGLIIGIFINIGGTIFFWIFYSNFDKTSASYENEKHIHYIDKIILFQKYFWSGFLFLNIVLCIFALIFKKIVELDLLQYII